MTFIDILFPLIFVVTCGFVAARIRFISGAQLDGIRVYIFNLAIPVLLFLSMFRADLSQVASASLLLAFYLPVVALYLLVFVLLRARFNLTMSDAALSALNSTYSNTVVVGLPVILAALGEQAAAMVFMIIPLHSAVLFSLTFILARRANGGVEWLKPLFLNPVVLSISLGLIANLMSLSLPALLLSGMEWFAQPAIAGALFVLGASLVQYGFRPVWYPALMLSIVKLLILPLCVYLTATLLALEPLQRQVVTLMSAAPLGVNAYLVARQLGVQQAISAGSVVLSTLLSVVSLSLWLAILSI
ncbi:AEC family transporter [Pseudoalteromonas viridis]|uniref:AEC family transporter n=1 Tax=Pseudoalteromonas viridis TaxID=339617 RepID=A0ABX7V8L5_9GAMM|nr:AEC family transporter [Pseudoalteromonas viridis]QTL36840.1 AEC family transporter [Pseudoalteromonas viridis]